MKKLINISKICSLLALIVMLFNACDDDDENFERTRLFRPVLNENLYTEGNTIIVNMGSLRQAVSYTMEVSRDTFQTIDYTFESDTSYMEINSSLVGEELLWNAYYQVRATAHAADSQYDSRPSDLGSVKTKKFPGPQGTPNLQFDVTDTRARVFWSTAGDPIVNVKVFAGQDLRLTSPLQDIDLTEEQMDINEAVVTGLTPDTKYQIAIYSEDTIRGWEVYETKPALDFGDAPVYDLSGIENDLILYDTLTDVENGAVIILEPGKIYQAGGYAFSKSVLLVSGYGFTPSLPIIECGSNYNIEAGATIDSITFRNIRFQGDFGGGYVFNIDQDGSLGEIKFDGCEIHSLRGITRIKGGTGTIQDYSIVNSVADSINGYGVFYVDTDGWQAHNVWLTNSTFSKTQYFLASRTNTTGSITIESCTIDQAPEQGRQMFRWRGGDGKNNVLGGIRISNTIWGPGWNMAGGEVFAVRGTEGLASTSFNVVNTWVTSDFAFSSDEIPGFPAFTFSGSADDLWADREALDYSIQASGFAASNSAGDPRWRPE
ncbi:DUF5123 domain-containing protein [Fulvivirga maritima]|uniref:DUF5123 domain-containing protein n=1 Tax=Fulvivirga maritima TaxID=2904247 RepID=UPI001F1A5418|nr:DUF5123 domain-containing protein [Fulvivirga maritima]UII27153.1 DUF5123 domain-containing protein [Fulvivirga maritima]